MTFDRRKTQAIVLCDLHLSDHNSSVVDSFLRLLGLVHQHKLNLYILGDLFLTWLGPRRLHTCLQTTIVEKLYFLKAQGQSIVYVEGNRDFFIKENLEHLCFSKVIRRNEVLNIGNVPTLLLHGDGLNKNDWPYRSFRYLTKNTISKIMLSCASGAWPSKLAEEIESLLQNTNQKHKMQTVMPEQFFESLQKLAKEKKAKRVMMGHFHIQQTFCGHPEIYIVKDFLDGQYFLTVSHDGDLQYHQMKDVS